MKTNKSLMLALILVLASINFGCTGKHPADVAATIVVPGTEGYFTAERQLISLRKLGVINDAQWVEIDKVCDQADLKYDDVWAAWYTLSLAKTPENEAELAAQIAELMKWVVKLKEYLK